MAHPIDANTDKKYQGPRCWKKNHWLDFANWALSRIDLKLTLKWPLFDHCIDSLHEKVHFPKPYKVPIILYMISFPPILHNRIVNNAVRLLFCPNSAKITSFKFQRLWRHNEMIKKEIFWKKINRALLHRYIT